MLNDPEIISHAGRLRECREQAKLTRTQVAERLGVAMSTLQNWEEGRGSPQMAHLSLLCDLYGCSADYLLMRNEAQNTKSRIGQFLVDDGTVSAILNADHWNQIESLIDTTPPLVTFWMQVQEGSRWLTRTDELVRIERQLDAKLRQLADTKNTQTDES